MKKICYIAHAVGGGDVDKNLEDLRRIIRKTNLDHPDVVAFCPYYADAVSMDDSIPSERGRGMENDIEIINRGIVDELWLTGPRISAGMQQEVIAAVRKGILIVDYIGKI